MRKFALSLAGIALALPLLAAAPAQAQGPRVWVSGTGDDGSPTCSRTAPCRTFAIALSRTGPGGEINCLDAGEFGQVVISVSLTISCAAGTAAILAGNNFQTGITVTAGATDVVTLRGLDIDGQGSGMTGIDIFSARAVHIEKCTIRNVRAGGAGGAGIAIPLVASTVFLFVSDTVISDNSLGIALDSNGGFKVASLKNVTISGSTFDGLNLFGSNVYVNVTKSVISGSGGSAVIAQSSGNTVNVDRSTIANNAFGLSAASGAIIRISGNNIYNNTTGFSFAGGAFIQTDTTNNAGGSNGGAQTPNASLAKN